MAGSAGVAAGISVVAASGDDGAEGAGGIEPTELLHPALRTTRLSSAMTEWRFSLIWLLVEQIGGGRNLRRRDPTDVAAGHGKPAGTSYA